jgi:hypothetical protein
LLPTTAWDGGSFDLIEIGAQRALGVSLDNPKFWAYRIDDADKSVAQRTWTVEIEIGEKNPSLAILGCRLKCITRGTFEPFLPSVPAVVRQIVTDSYAIVDGRRVLPKAWMVDNNAGVEELVALLRNPRRAKPVIIGTMGSRFDPQAAALIDMDDLAARTVGAAHVVILSHDATFALTDELGKDYSVFNQAIRTYAAGFDDLLDNPFRHPRASAESVIQWEGIGPQAFSDFLVRQILNKSVVGDIEAVVPSFTTIQNLASEERRKKAKVAGASDSEQLKMALEENKQLKDQLNDDRATNDGLLQVADNDRRIIEDERDEYKNLTYALTARVQHLVLALKECGKSDSVIIPKDLECFEEWTRANLAGSVFIHSRALRAVSKSKFEDPELVYKTLTILRDKYLPMRIEGGSELKKQYEDALAGLGLDDTPSFSGDRAGEEGDAYKIQYDGQTCFLDHHIKGSSSRDERYGFRLYYFWDSIKQVVVVGWLPSHLPTRAS